MTTEYPFIHAPYSMATWPTKNTIVDQHSIKKRPGYNTRLRNLGAGVSGLASEIYAMKDGTRFTLYLTNNTVNATYPYSDLCCKQTGTNETFSYATETGDNDDSVASVSGTTVTFKASTVVYSATAIAIGDKFILDIDHSASIEPDTNWATISATANAGGYFTTLTLSASYTGTTGTWTGSEKDCLIRRIYTVPANERWATAIVADKFIFTNGNTDVQYWGGSSYAADLETGAATATKARYCIEYANRLVIADFDSTRNPFGIAWSKEGDPTDWSDVTYGEADLLETKDTVTGLGKVGAQLIVYKRESLSFWYRTGNATIPLARGSHRDGIGMTAPYSLAKYMGANAFLGRDNFYKLEGNEPIPIGNAIRDKFFELSGHTEAEQTWSFVDSNNRLIHWFTDTEEGQYAWVWNYQTEEWTVFKFFDEISGAGRGTF